MIKFNIPYVAISLMAERAGIKIEVQSPMNDFLAKCAEHRKKLGAENCEAMLAELAQEGYLTIKGRKISLSSDMEDVVKALCAPRACIRIRFRQAAGSELFHYTPIQDSWMKVTERQGILYCECPVPEKIVELEILTRLSSAAESGENLVEIQTCTRSKIHATVVSCGEENYQVLTYLLGEEERFDRHDFPKTQQSLKEIYEISMGRATGKEPDDYKKINWLHVGRGALIATAVYICMAVFNTVLRNLLM